MQHKLTYGANHALPLRRRLYKSNAPSDVAPTGQTRRNRHKNIVATSDTFPRQGRGHYTSTAPKTAYFVYLLVGVHHSYAAAKAAHWQLAFAKYLPVTFERNENGLGKCKTWLAVSKPFTRRIFADIAVRQLSLYMGEGAVCVRRGEVL